jgi:hypothetical protein
MRSRDRSFVTILGVMVLPLVMLPSAFAQCGMPTKPMSWHPKNGAQRPSLVRTALDENGEPSIVGMWHVVFTAQTMNGAPFSGVIDNAVAQWHSDGTEIMNSARPAQDGNFCLGVWKRTGSRTYLLNHIPWQGNVFDPMAPPDTIGAPQDGVQIIEKIILSPDGNSYSGTFTLNAYDSSGHVYTSFSGVISAKRITPDTPFTDLL